jgi:RimJ/RimL family protein N-acetyltransferase
MQLKDIKEDDFHDIFRLTRQEKIMKYVGNGKPWYEKRVLRFIHYNTKEAEMEDKYRTQYYYKIVEDNLFAGIIGFHIQGTSKYVLTIYLMKSKQGQGYFSKALELLKKKMKKHKPYVDRLYAQVYPENEIMNKIMEKKYFYNGDFKLGRVNLKEYIIFLRKNTYVLYPIFSNKEMLIKNLEKRGNWKAAEKDETIDFLYLEGRYIYDKKLYNLNSLVKNQIKDDNFFIKKDKLYNILSPLEKDYLLETYNFNDKEITKIADKFDGEKIWIVKPAKGYIGKGIKITKNYEDLTKHIKNNKNYKEWSLQAYIREPILYNNRKFHIRFYILVDDENNYYLFKYGAVALAQELYALTDFDNDKIHDTHFRTTEEELYYPTILGNDLEKIEKVDNTIREIILDVKNKATDIKCYPESKKCYEILGMDVMINEEFKVKLLEINNKLGLPEEKSQISSKLFEGQLKIYLDKYFPPKKEIKEINYFEKIEN